MTVASYVIREVSGRTHHLRVGPLPPPQKKKVFERTHVVEPKVVQKR